jgi:hypothetical protein
LAIKDFTSTFPKWLELINGPDPSASLPNALSDTPSRYFYESSHRYPKQRAYARELLGAGLGPSIGIMTIGMERRANFLHYWLYLQCEQKALFVTQNGYIGFGPHSVGVGDLIVLFSGMKVPFVVRRVGMGWKLVGPVHVHGIMQEEWWDERRGMEEFQLAWEFVSWVWGLGESVYLRKEMKSSGVSWLVTPELATTKGFAGFMNWQPEMY